MVSRRFVMNRRLFSYSELPFCDTFPVVVIGKAESVAVDVQSHIVVGEHRSRGEKPIAFRGTVIFSATFPSLTASRSPVWQSSLVLLAPIVPLMQSTLPNTPRTSILLLPQPRRSVAPFLNLGNDRSVLRAASASALRSSEVGVCVCECGKVTALKASADHRFASCAAMQGFQPLCFAPMVFRTAPSCTCTTLCLLSASPLVALSLSF